MNDTTLGIIAAAVPLIVIGFFALRRLPWILAFFLALVAVGIGYLDTTGAMKDFGHQVRANLPAGLIPEHKTAEESAPAEGGAMKALPAAETPPPAAPAAETTATPPATPPAAPAPAPAAESTPAAPAATETPAAPAAPAPEAKPETPAAPATPAPANP